MIQSGHNFAQAMTAQLIVEVYGINLQPMVQNILIYNINPACVHSVPPIIIICSQSHLFQCCDGKWSSKTNIHVQIVFTHCGQVMPDSFAHGAIRPATMSHPALV